MLCSSASCFQMCHQLLCSFNRICGSSDDVLHHAFLLWKVKREWSDFILTSVWIIFAYGLDLL